MGCCCSSELTEEDRNTSQKQDIGLGQSLQPENKPSEKDVEVDCSTSELTEADRNMSQQEDIGLGQSLQTENELSEEDVEVDCSISVPHQQNDDSAHDVPGDLSRVQILNISNTQATKSFVDELQQLLQENKIETTLLSSTDKPEHKKIIIICNDAYIENLYKGDDKGLDRIEEDQYKNVILVVLHVKLEDKLPFRSPQKRLSESPVEKYRNIYNVVDMGFLRDSGIYTCTTNDKALDVITDFCLSAA